MRYWFALFFLLVGCASQAPQPHETLTEIKPRPAIRESIVPGMTLGNVPLQKKTLDYIKGGVIAKTSNAGCDASALLVTDTYPFSEPEPSHYSIAFKEWVEIWTFDACGQEVVVEIKYMEHSSGIISLTATLQA